MALTPLPAGTPSDNKQILQELTGGLTLLPYGIYPLFAALAFQQGWIDWETNNGPPYLGFVLAWFIDRGIRWYYQRKYHFSFSMHGPNNKPDTGFSIKDLLKVLSVLVFLAAWMIDENVQGPVRWMPLLFGFWTFWEGVGWIKRHWIRYGLVHFLLGLFPTAVSILPMWLDVPSRNQFFGSDGIFELAAIGVVLIVVGLMEHLIFLRIWNDPDGQLPGLPSDAVI